MSFSLERGTPPFINLETKDGTLSGSRERLEEPKKIVAVIGAGPAGVALAETLASNNIAVTLFDRNPRVGGTVLTGHTPSQTRTENLREMERVVQSSGLIKFIHSEEIGKDIPFDVLVQAGYAAVVLAIGANKEIMPTVEGVEELRDRGVFEHRKVRRLVVDFHDASVQTSPSVWEAFPLHLMGQQGYEELLQHHGLTYASQEERMRFLISYMDRACIIGSGRASAETAKFLTAWTIHQGLRLLGKDAAPDPVEIMNRIDAKDSETISEVTSSEGYGSRADFSARLAQNTGIHLEGPTILLAKHSNDLGRHAVQVDTTQNTQPLSIKIIKDLNLTALHKNHQGWLSAVSVNERQNPETVRQIHTNVLVPTLGARIEAFPGMPEAQGTIFFAGAAKNGHNHSIHEISQDAAITAMDVILELQETEPNEICTANIRSFEKRLQVE